MQFVQLLDPKTYEFIVLTGNILQKLLDVKKQIRKSYLTSHGNMGILQVWKFNRFISFVEALKNPKH